MPLIYTDSTVLKVDAQGREAMSSYIDTDAGEFRRKDSMLPSASGRMVSMTPSSGAYAAATEVTITGTDFMPTMTYWTRSYVGTAKVVEPIDSIDSDTQITATLPSGPGMDGLISGPDTIEVRLACRPYPGAPVVELPGSLTFTFTA